MSGSISPIIAFPTETAPATPEAQRLLRSTSTVTDPRPTVLCVDDDQSVLDGVAAVLRKNYEVTTVLDADAALAAMESAVQRSGPYSIVLTDMRMPGMDGIALLNRVRNLYPDSVRVLLTGEADLTDAARAVNEGEVFRFLTKPCPAELLQETLAAGMEHLRQIARGRARVREHLIALNHAFREEESHAELRARAADAGQALSAHAPTLRSAFMGLLDCAAAGNPPDAWILDALARASEDVETQGRELLELGGASDETR